MKVIITGAAGFIGSDLALHLLHRGDTVLGIDNHNDYYDIKLKKDRVNRAYSKKNYTHIIMDIENRYELADIFKKFKPDTVVNLAAQAGVQYSMINPYSYIGSNIVGFHNILEACRNNNVKHFVYASSSSVYGANKKLPFSTHQSVNHPLSLYAATKKANELIAHSYSYLYGIRTTGLRFFTVYGPWGRPDMALFKFTKKILNNEPVQLFNYGQHTRDFTYIDDIIFGIEKVLDSPAKSNQHWSGLNPDPATSIAPWRVINIGNNKPIMLRDYLKQIEESLGINAIIHELPMQPGDVLDTCAEIDDLVHEFDYTPKVGYKEGVDRFIKWYCNYYKA